MDQTCGNSILTGFATCSLPTRVGAFTEKVLWTFGCGFYFLINYSIQYFVLLTWISKKVLEVVSIHIRTCLTPEEEIFGYLLQLIFCNIVYHTPYFILKSL